MRLFAMIFKQWKQRKANVEIDHSLRESKDLTSFFYVKSCRLFMVGNNKRCFEVNLLKRTFRDVMLEKKKDEEQGYLAVRSCI